MVQEEASGRHLTETPFALRLYPARALFQPELSYREIFTAMVDANVSRTPREWLPGARRAVATVLTVVLPKGCLIRTAQVRICYSPVYVSRWFVGRSSMV